MVKVKICGITNLEDALVAVNAGADALGFIFYKKSPRYIHPKKAAGIIARLPRRIRKVGVFVNALEKDIRGIAKLCSLDLLQFHGEETPEFCARFKGYKIIKAFRVKDKLSLKDISSYKTFAYLFDSYLKAKPGGTGKKFNWELIPRSGIIKRPVFLSGGLNQDNVLAAIKTVRPDWVDVSSSLEADSGTKDHKKMMEFIELVKKARRFQQMKRLTIFLAFFLSALALCFAQSTQVIHGEADPAAAASQASTAAQKSNLLIDDFENPITGGPDGTLDFGAGGGSTIEASADTGIKNSGKQSLKITYDAIEGGYMWAARGINLDAKNAQWLVSPESIDWKKFTSITFYMYGSNSGANIALDIKDSGGEIWRFMLKDSFAGWKKITCLFKDFVLRDDWQPDSATKNSILDFPIKSFQFEPRPVSKGTLYFDTVSLE